MMQYEWNAHFVANSSRLMDRRWLESEIQPHAHINRMDWRGKRPRISQFPHEFADFLVTLAEHQVQSYIEIGTSTGGSFMLADSYLRAAVQGYRGAIGFDITFKLRNWDVYSRMFPSTTFTLCDSRKIDLKDARHGAAFVDARHLERFVLSDYEKVRRNCTLVGFHDIVLEGASVWPAWCAIKAGPGVEWAREIVDQSAPPRARCGIGLVKHRQT